MLSDVVAEYPPQVLLYFFLLTLIASRVPVIVSMHFHKFSHLILISNL